MQKDIKFRGRGNFSLFIWFCLPKISVIMPYLHCDKEETVKTPLSDVSVGKQ